MSVVAAVCLGLALMTACYALLSREARTTADRLAHIAGTDGLGSAAPGLRDRVVRPLAGGFVEAATALLPGRLGRVIEARLAAAGQPMTPGTFLVLMVVGPLASVLLTMPLLAGASTGGPLLVLACGALGVASPLVWLSGRVTRNQRALDRALPDVLDLVVVSVEAGLGLEGAFERIIERGQGPLVDEIRHVLVDMNLGLGRRRALQSLASRTGVPSIGVLVTALLQAEQTGMGIAQVLRVQADHLRIQRRQRAEEQAMKAPLKMLFPLVFFIFPSLFVVVLGPPVLELMRTLKDG